MRKKHGDKAESNSHESNISLIWESGNFKVVSITWHGMRFSILYNHVITRSSFSFNLRSVASWRLVQWTLCCVLDRLPMVSLSRRRPWQNLINWKRRSRPESSELPDSHQPISFARTWLQDILKANDQGKLSKIFDCKELPDAD